MLILLLVLMLAASITTFHTSARVYVRVAVAWTVAFLTFSQFAGLSLRDMGLANWHNGLLWAAACIGIVAIAMVAGAQVPRLHPLFADERAIRVSGAEVAVKSLIEVPMGTVLLEEVVFRSVLLGLLTVEYGVVVGVLGSSFLFGLWHILPSLEMHDSHSLTSQLGTGWRSKLMTVLGTILATGAAGVGFAMLVVWSGSVLAPVGLHWAMNSIGSVAAWFVARRAARLRQLEIEQAQREADLAAREAQVAAHDAQLADREAAIARREAHLAGIEAAVAARESALAERESALARVRAELAAREAALAGREPATVERSGAGVPEPADGQVHDARHASPGATEPRDAGLSQLRQAPVTPPGAGRGRP